MFLIFHECRFCRSKFLYHPCHRWRANVEFSCKRVCACKLSALCEFINIFQVVLNGDGERLFHSYPILGNLCYLMSNPVTQSNSMPVNTPLKTVIGIDS